jgi:filamentous hemagglutinin family protein
MMAQERSGFWKSCFTIAFALSMGVVPGYGDRASAQIIPDETLGNEPSLVTPIDEQVDHLDGGAIRGSNLFHSFREFNVGEGRGAYFANPAAIANIFSRVTGSNPSNILGTLGVLGEANLFVLNPNGILFGPNAKLDLKGSFLATTADSILFPEGKQFSATNPEAPPILTVNVQAPIGLQFEGKETVGRIENRSTAPAGEDLLENPVFGLRVPDDRSLLLVGGDITIDGGGLNALGGRVELGGVLGNGTIGLSVDGNDLNLNFPEDIARSDISLSNEAFVNTSGEGGGKIQVWSRRLILSEGSQIAATTLGSKAGEGLTVNALESVELAGTTTDNQLSSGLFAQTGGKGNAGNLTITTKNLRVQNGARVLASTRSQGNAGNLTVNASESVQMIGTTGITPNGRKFSSRLSADTTKTGFGSRLDSQTEVTGDAGNLTINTKQLLLQNGGQLGASTTSAGNSGILTINASESVKVIGFETNDFISRNLFIVSNLGSQANPDSTGNGGDLIINTGQLIVRDGGQIKVSSFGDGDAGNLIINASESVQAIGGSKVVLSNDSSLLFYGPSGLFSGTQGKGDAGNLTITTPVILVKDGAIISTETTGSGESGNLTVNASESIQLIGTAPNLPVSSGLFSITSGTAKAGELIVNTKELIVNEGQVSASTKRQGDAGNITLQVQDNITLSGSKAGLFSNTEKGSSGNGGNIFIDPTTMIIRDGAQVAVNSSGIGIGGNIELQAGSLTLDRGTITAETASNQGGNINLKTSDLLLLRNNSQISSTAGTDRAGGDGGNITIDAPFIVAVAKENSNIQANAFEGNGGNININTNGIFGIESRDRETLLSDITASSQFGREGQVEINTSGIDPTRSLTNLPQETVEAEVAQGCQTEGGQPKVAYFDIGRGGLPPTPDDLFNSEIVIAEWIPLDFEEDKQKQQILENSFTENKLTLLRAFPCQKSTQKSIN